MTKPDQVVDDSQMAAVDRDAYLCYCTNVTHDDFRQAVWRYPNLSFTDVCENSNVGPRCTACLLNAENLYDKARKEPPRDVVSSQETIVESAMSLRQRLYRSLDAFGPMIGVSTLEVVPIFRGCGLTTTVTIANSKSRLIGARSAAFKGEVQICDAQGSTVGSRSFLVAPGERFDLRVSDFLDGMTSDDDLVVGSCWIERMGVEAAYRGSIRGHFTIRTPHSTTAVHAQEPQKAGLRTIMVSRANASEEHSLSFVNCSDRTSQVRAGIAPLGEKGQKTGLTKKLPPRGAVLLRLPPAAAVNGNHIHVVEVESEQRARYHLAISSVEGSRLSIDHV